MPLTAFGFGDLDADVPGRGAGDAPVQLRREVLAAARVGAHALVTPDAQS